MQARTTAGRTTAARRMLARTTAGGATVIRPEQVRVTAGSVTADPMAMAPRTRVVRHLPVTGPAAAPMTLGTKTCPGTCTLTTEQPTSAPQLTRARTTMPSVQRTGRAETCARRPGLPCLCRARPLLRAAPARPARARPAHKTGAAHPQARAWPGVPCRTLAGWSCEPGELSRVGPVTAEVARDLALAAAADATCDWKVIVVGRSGRAVAVAKVRRSRADAQVRSAGSPSAAASGSGDAGVVGWITLTIPAGLLSPTATPLSPTATSAEKELAGSGPLAKVLAAALRAGAKAFSARRSRIAAGGCAHEEASPDYRVPDSMRALVEARDQTCGFPTCRQPAWRCEQDHTIAHRLGGPTCPCNLSPECPRHHHLKHLPSWRLDQPRPGVLTWTTPARLTHTVTSAPYPV